MKKNDIILYAAIAGGGYLAYWYMTNYGPLGPVGQGRPSYWDTWFGGVTPQVQPGTQQPGVQVQPAQQIPSVYTTTPTTTTTQPANLSVRDRMAQAATGNAFMDSAGRMNADQWNWYRNQITGSFLNGADFSAAFPDRNIMLTLDQWISAGGLNGAAGVSGLGAIVPATPVQSLPSMTFGGAFKNQGGMRGMLNMGGHMKGPVQ